MGHFLFFLAVLASCLLWSAAFTAAAARTRPGWIRRGLIVAAVATPVLAVAPWAFITAVFAFWAWMETNWFGPTLTTALAVVIGGVWIMRAGLSPRAAPAAGDWPLMRLVAMFVLTTAVAFGTLWLIDTSIQNEMRMVRIEAAQIMQSVATPQPLLDDDAAPLYLQAWARLEADDVLTGPESPLRSATRVDVASVAVADLLARHAGTLDVLRRAADRPGCRFVRDWWSPSFSLTDSESYQMSWSASLLALAARRTAADKEVVTALADMARLRRMAAHLAAEPFLTAGVVATEIDEKALEALTSILPQITAKDAAVLDDSSVADTVRWQPSCQRQILGDEACGLVMFADIAEGRMGPKELWEGAVPTGIGIVHRCFLLPADLAAYRAIMRRTQHLVIQASSPGVGYAEIADDIRKCTRREGPQRTETLTNLFASSLGEEVVNLQFKSQARHRAAEVLLAATRARLKTGSLPESTDSLVLEFLIALPADPYRDQGPLTVKIDAAGWLVYSVGPDGEDDGGPPQDSGHVDGNDDVGLRLSR